MKIEIHPTQQENATTKDPGQGVGLGLSISYTLIAEHKGEIEARNTNEGVLFTITLPLT